MSSQTVVFVAYFEQDNLGVGYIASMLIENGYHIHFIDATDGLESVTTQINQIRPITVGFSIIFEYHFSAFRKRIWHLRELGV